MACGLPVLTTPVGAIQTIITHQENGILVEPGNEAQLFEALDVMLSDEELISRLGRAGRQTVCAHYSAASATTQYISLFQDTLQPKGTK